MKKITYQLYTKDINDGERKEYEPMQERSEEGKPRSGEQQYRFMIRKEVEKRSMPVSN